MSLPDANDYIFRYKGDIDDGMPWHVTNEWLCGSFAGRSFSGGTPEEAIVKLIEYFDNHQGHPSMVGRIIGQSGWPDMAEVTDFVREQCFDCDPEDFD